MKMASRQRASCGRDYNCCPDINNTLEDACKGGFDFVCVPLVNPRYKREFIAGPAVNRPGSLTRSDLLLTNQDWSSLVVAKISPWLQVDSVNDIVRKNSEKALKQELNYASHLSVPAVLISVKQARCPNLARIINQHVSSGNNHQLWIHVPLLAPEDQCGDLMEVGQGEGHMEATEDEDRGSKDTWTWWNSLRVICDHHKKLGLALELTADLPPADIIERWLGEPIKTVVIPTKIFLTNRKGYPVLSRAHQILVQKLFKLDVQFIIKGACRHAEKGVKTYQQYIDHLWETQEPPDNVAQFAKGYEDFLQCPLQPLMDNLESGTYEVFEKDPVKYSQYQKAVYQALLDRVPYEEKDTKVLIVMVLGAGRGPLVSASLTAASKAERKIKVYAVEKNPNAVVTLQNQKHEMWGELVTVVSSDMRLWNAPEKADIIVSELLGSFGDNELSPECLDGAQKFLKEDGISIPQEYTSYVSPISSSKLWNETRTCRDVNKPPDASFETPYVVRLQNVHVLNIPKPLFTFVHPNRDAVVDNNRYGSLEFDIPIETVLHGFAGYFDCILYKDVTLSIVPDTHSLGMFSWFPLYFPIKEPMSLRKGDLLTVHFWRMCTNKNVWYEWCVTDPYVRPLHNPKGRSYTIGL